MATGRMFTDQDVKNALDELKFFSREFKILGVYPAHAFRATFRVWRSRRASSRRPCLSVGVPVPLLLPDEERI